ncbi:glycosyltransferase [Paenibacillus shunpengii]|uniref:Glycosyltransferase n=1 Tax=Paenibacillus shunpengii TaxID=2054424 RepID=A0ABW5SV60_9BACL
MISVIMPVYNVESYIKQSVESILNQTESNLELIIIDDGSTDKSAEIIDTINDDRIILIHQENQGAASARNKGIDVASGDYIVFQDADDVSLHNRLEILKRQFTSSNIGIVHSDMLTVDKDGSPTGYWQSRSMEKKRVLRFFLKIGTFINGASMMLRREVFDDLRYDVNLRIGEDTHLILKALKKWESVHVPDPLYIYRKHDSNTTQELNYDILTQHIRQIIHEHSVEELIPEAFNNVGRNGKIRAYAILSLFLFRRNMAPDAVSWYEKSITECNSIEDQYFIYAINEIINNNYTAALRYLYKCESKDHIVENYIGEILTILGDFDLAYYHFKNAIVHYPNYEEALENIKSLGAKKSYNLLDTSWLKFKSV